jgi:hypothetical protein
MRKGSAIIRPVHVSVRIGEPIATAGLAVDDRDRLIERVRIAIAALLHEGSVWETSIPRSQIRNANLS